MRRDFLGREFNKNHWFDHLCVVDVARRDCCSKRNRHPKSQFTDMSNASSIRPVSRRLPASKELWEETNLPLAVVLNPCNSIVSTSVPTSSSQRQQPHPGSNIRPLMAIPKCLQCGAPHPTKDTHYRPMHHSVLICFLCGKTSSTLLEDQQEVRIDEDLDAGVYDRVVIKDPTSDYQVPLFRDKWTLPAMECPPVWWIVLDASCTNATYWNCVGTVLAKIMEEIPPYVHVGMLAATASTVSTWDLTTPIPHVLHVPQTSNDVELCIVPADATHLSFIHSALRAVADYHGGAGLATQQPVSTSFINTSAKNKGMALGGTLELILEYLDVVASHPAYNQRQDIGNDENNSATTNTSLTYAGGKILCLLSGPPMEIEARQHHMPQPYYTGGIAGSCSPIDHDKWNEEPVPSSPEKTDPTDMTPSNLMEFIAPINEYGQFGPGIGDDYFQLLGTKCADASLGVDVVVVCTESESMNTTCFGLPLLRGLCDRSGAPGPIVMSALNMDNLHEQVMARTPWQPGMTFGNELRLRITTGFEVDSSPVEASEDEQPLQLAPFCSSGGIMGPATAVPGETNLWRMGSCDPHTSITVDLQVEPVVNDRYNVDGFGEVALKPVIQTCFAYTCIERLDNHDDDDNDGDVGRTTTNSPTYHAVRKLRISSHPLPLSYEVEPLYDALDPEALAVVLFHKLTISSLQDGLVETQEIGKSWLKSLLMCVYESAEVQQEKHADRISKGLPNGVESDSSFVGSERLIDQEGELSLEDVLLGQGHHKIQIIPFLLYALLQCDAFRPTCDSFQPSIDARCAAAAQMSSMTPSVLSKCVAPCLQLWSTQYDSPIFDMLDLKLKTIQNSLHDSKEDDILFLDSPQQVILCDARRFLNSINISGATENRPQPITVPPKLQAAFESAIMSYRTPPPTQLTTLEQNVSSSLDEKQVQDEIKLCLSNVLIEDKPMAMDVRDFDEWKMNVSTMVQEMLEGRVDT